MGFTYQTDICEKYGLYRKDVFELTSEMVDVEPITVWRVFEEGFNHYDEGHVSGTSPIPNCEYQKKKWNNKIWIKSFQYMLWFKVKFNPIFPGRPIGKIV